MENLTAMVTDGSKPSKGYCRKVKQMGTVDQIKALESRLSAFGLSLDTYISGGNSQTDRKYAQGLKDKSMTVAHTDHPSRLSAFIHGKMGLGAQKPPEGLNYALVRRLVWNSFVTLVSISKNIRPDEVTPDSYQLRYLKNITAYLIGSSEGEWDASRSLYFYGDLGRGKSTLVEIIHHVSKYIEKEFNWSYRSFDYCSMDELFLDTYTSGKLSKVGAFSEGCWVLDELREEHALYKYFGNDLLILNDILSVRYNLWSRKKVQTVITSNMGAGALMALFDDNRFDEKGKSRLTDRIKQQYQSVLIEGENKRPSDYNK